MSNLLEKVKTFTSTYRRYGYVATFVVVVLMVLLMVVLWYKAEYALAPVASTSLEDAVMVVEGETMPAAAPVRLKIPNAYIDAPFSTPLGLQDDGEVEVPTEYDSVGYYKHGPTPGELGPAVVLGHVDSASGPAVFFSLGQLEVGDQIEIVRADSSVAIFAVTELERLEQSVFPTTKVYGDIHHAGLRLITCTGIYDRGEARYTHNLIVYGKLIATSTESGG